MATNAITEVEIMSDDPFETSWVRFCRDCGDRVENSYGFYLQATNTPHHDFEVCKRHAAKGVDRAVKYMKEFAKWRMKQ
jgi:hypothetical protein